MTGRGASARQLSERETQIWRGMPSAEYERSLCAMLDDIGTAPPAAERAEALLAVASASLRRRGAALADSRACCAEHLLALHAAVPEPALRARVRLLVLLAWLQLAAAACGPDSIAVTPDLPPGVALPDGADPAAIADPALREQARQAADRHGEAAARWNAKQRALGHLHRLATLVAAARTAFGDDDATDLVVAMSLAPGLPPAVRRLLEDAAT